MRALDEKLISTFLGVSAGAVGYWISTFWMRPILQYWELRMKVFADFIFYAQVVNADRLNERMKQLYEERITSNRRNSADLAACLLELPAWFVWLIRRKGQTPDRAVANLIGYSNTTNCDDARKQMSAVKKALGMSESTD